MEMAYLRGKKRSQPMNLFEESPKEQILRLRNEIERLNKLYYQDAISEISDQEYDALQRSLIDLETQYPQFATTDSPTLRVGDDRNRGFAQVRHRIPMLSLDNTYSLTELQEFDRRIHNTLQRKVTYTCELKYDGVAISLIYQNGLLHQAITRGNGEEGDDVTQNVKTIRNIPHRLTGSNWPNYFEARGEIYMPRSTFRQLNEERERQGEAPFANPRNATAGSLKLHDSQIVKQRGLECALYQILTPTPLFSEHQEALKTARNWGLPVSAEVALCNNIDEVARQIESWGGEREALPFETDGVVVKVNSLSDHEKLGTTAKSPRWAIAYKYPTEQVRTELEGVEFQVGRTGSITPVANLSAVQLGGSTVRRATLHNADQLARLDLHYGDTVLVEKGGEIIPKIVSVVVEERKPGGTPVVFPTVCPACGETLQRKEGEARHFCPNTLNCPAQVTGAIEHFASRKALNIEGLGAKVVAQLYEAGLITNLPDLYTLKIEDLLKLERFRKRSAENLIDALRRSLSTPFPQVLFGLGIPNVGETTAQRLAYHFGSIDALMSASKEELLTVPDVGEILAEEISSFFSREANQRVVESLRSIGFNLTAERPETRSSTLEGWRVVVSGRFERYSRNELKQELQAAGATLLSAVSSNTTHVVAGQGMGPAKLAKAESLGVRIVSEEEIHKILEH